MSKEKWSKIAWIVIAICFIILIIIGQIRIKEQNQLSNTIIPRSDVQKNPEGYNKKESEILEGTISEIAEDYIVVLDSFNQGHRIDKTEFINSRTRDKIHIKNILTGDYYKNGEIVRNISGEELRQELLLNMSRAFNSSKLSVKFTRLKRLQTYEGYSTFKVRFYDGNYKVFEKENPELFFIELKADENTVLYARTNVVTIYNLQKYVRNEALEEKSFYIGLDEKTLNDETPLVTNFEIAE